MLYNRKSIKYFCKNINKEERCVEIGEYISKTGSTVREAASKFGVSKSTVHTVVTK